MADVNTASEENYFANTWHLSCLEIKALFFLHFAPSSLNFKVALRDLLT